NIMKLIIGLGNPGKKYEETWHNLGFLAIDQIKQFSNRNFSEFKENKKFKAVIAEANQIDEKIILAKPQTFMNNSGQAVAALAKFYKILPQDVWLIHDDIDLPLGRVRISQNASAGGHKGVQSVIDSIGTQQFVRFRVGIDSDKKGQIPTEDYVLQNIGSANKIIIDEAIKQIVAAIELALIASITEAMNEYN
ncbi:MAG: aminoacyl-tRNA hydrolase, partial [Patescibacteria group bacterium]|nr:aminoacyl-tRNA hydrolase [Patescibacteria group bacterium]